MKKLKKFLSLVFIACLFLLFSLNIRFDAKIITPTEELEKIAVPNEVISSFVVPSTGIAGSIITWESSNEAVIDTSYINETNGWVLVNRNQTIDETVTLTLTISRNGFESVSKSFVITVLKGVTIYGTRTINLVDGEFSQSFTFEVGKKILLPEPIKPGYNFKGWEYQGKLYSHTFGLIEVENATFTAVYEEKEVEKIVVATPLNKLEYNAFE